MKGMRSGNLVPRVSRAKRDPGRVWSRASVTIENTREGSSLNKEFVALSFVEFKASLGIDKILTKPPLPSLDKLSSPRFWETRDQTLPGSLLARPRR